MPSCPHPWREGYQYGTGVYPCGAPDPLRPPVAWGQPGRSEARKASTENQTRNIQNKLCNSPLISTFAAQTCPTKDVKKIHCLLYISCFVEPDVKLFLGSMKKSVNLQLKYPE